MVKKSYKGYKLENEKASLTYPLLPLPVLFVPQWLIPANDLSVEKLSLYMQAYYGHIKCTISFKKIINRVLSHGLCSQFLFVCFCFLNLQYILDIFSNKF